MTDSAIKRLELQGVTKSFPGVLANDQVSFSVAPGEIYALLGENGAGKSTLVKMIYGIMQPDSGQILLDGVAKTILNPKDARRLGIGMVFQHFSLFEAMTVLENIALGLDEKIAHAELEKRIVEVMHEYGLSLDPDRIVSTLSVGERQRIEIVRALLMKPSLLIMDEPTSVLTPQEVSQLFDTLRTLATNGCSILYISHKLHEIKELCDGATVLRGGKNVGSCNPKEESSRSMAELMIGNDLQDIERLDARETGSVKFTVSNLNVSGDGDFGVTLDDINLTVHEGEIFGIAGVAGNGQNELLLALGGKVVSEDPSSIKIGGTPVGKMGATQRRKLGLCAVPEERNGHGAVPDFSLTENVVLTARNTKDMVTCGVIKTGKASRFANEVIEAFDVKTTGAGSVAGSLSGGNLQKFIMGREILQTPDVLIVSQPTWGVDAGAAAAIHQALIDLAEQGSAIVVISQDLDELLAICDKLAVINTGKLSKPLQVGEANIDDIGLLMGGISEDSGNRTDRPVISQ